jgi:hypothetical protein
MSSPRILRSATLALLVVLIAALFLLRSPASPPAHPANQPASATSSGRENRLLPTLHRSNDGTAVSISRADRHESSQHEAPFSPLEADASAQRAADAAERAAERATDRGTDQ